MTTTPTPEARIRVALVDDQALFRTGIRMLIDSQPDLQFVGEAGDGAEGVELVRRARPDVVLMDVRMPVLDGITATSRIVEQSGTDGAKVLVLTTFDFDEAAAKAIRAGASGFVLKDAD
ncbi:MAG: response regulator transcription factor, partial [Curtobacterium sp.]